MALAVPTHVVARLLGRAGRGAKDRATLGIEAHEVALPPALATLTGRDEERVSALLIAAVTANSAAERAGLMLGDLLYAVDGAPLEGSAGLLNALDEHALADGPLALGVLRGGAPQEVRVTWD
jgi:S1-C subfamily serine protease